MGEEVVMEPLRCQYMVAVLSVSDLVVRSRTSKHWAAASLWRKLPASSNSELLMVHWGCERKPMLAEWKLERRHPIVWGRSRMGWLVPACHHLCQRRGPVDVGWLLRMGARHHQRPRRRHREHQRASGRLERVLAIKLDAKRARIAANGSR